MAAITVDAETDVIVASGANVEVVAARASRRGLSIQHQGEGFLWVKLSGAAAIGDGFRLGAWQTLALGAGPAAQGNGVDTYEGAVNAFHEGGGSASVQGGGALGQTTVRVIELS